MAKGKTKEEQLKEQVKKQLQQKASTKKASPKKPAAAKNEAPDLEDISLPPASYSPPSRFFNKKAEPSDVAMFFRELAILIESGYPLLRGLTLLANKTANRSLAGDIDRIALQVEKGSSLAKAMLAFPWYFSPMVISMIETGEESGRLVEALTNIADDFEADEELTTKIREALSYPILTAIFAALAFVVILLFVVPTFASVYEQHNMKLPAITNILVWLSTAISDYWWLWIPILALAFYSLKKRIMANITYFDGLTIKIPIIGEIIIYGSMARFSASLNVLVSNGVPILQSLDLSKNSVSNTVIRKVIQNMRDNVENGKSMVQPMMDAGYFPPILVDMIMVGEEAGKLPFVLKQCVKTMRLKLDRIISRLSVTLGPIMTLVVGVMVLIIALSLFIPYFDFIMALAEIR